MFTLDQKLKEDSIFICDLQFCSLLLMNNKSFPWLILVPRKPDLKELIDLNFEEQIVVLKEINQISKILQNITKADKLNIAILGNVVNQLHIHIIARFKNDAAFPKPVFGHEITLYNEKDVQELISKIKNELQNYDRQ